MADMRELIEQLEEKRKKLQPGGGTAEIEKQHGRGKLTAWERIKKLFDPDRPVDPAHENGLRH